jgi:hypothetical protein
MPRALENHVSLDDDKTAGPEEHGNQTGQTRNTRAAAGMLAFRQFVSRFHGQAANLVVGSGQPVASLGMERRMAIPDARFLGLRSLDYGRCQLSPSVCK